MVRTRRKILAADDSKAAGGGVAEAVDTAASEGVPRAVEFVHVIRNISRTVGTFVEDLQLSVLSHCRARKTLRKIVFLLRRFVVDWHGDAHMRGVKCKCSIGRSYPYHELKTQSTSPLMNRPAVS